MKISRRRIFNYLNPLARLGKGNYSYAFPFIVTLSAAVAIELFKYYFNLDQSSTGLVAIFVFIALIVYFSFRDGIRGGFIATNITLIYYCYLIFYSLNYRGEELINGIETTIVLGILYFAIAFIIGYLKQNIDRLIQSEANEKRRLQAIIEQLPLGVIITDKDGYITTVNRRLEEILGKRFPKDFQIGRDSLMPAVKDGKSASIKQGPLFKVLHGGKTSAEEEFIVEKDGRKVYLRLNASVIKNKENKTIAAAEIITDITAQKELDERKDDFVNMASHELKTPLTSMKLYIASLMGAMKRSNDKKSLNTLKSIDTQTQRLQKIVNDLLDLSRLQTGKLSFSKEELDLVSLVRETVDELQNVTDQKINFKAPSSVMVNADRFRIYQVITNLINNAIKYSSKDGDINVAIIKSKGYAQVSIQDFGVGISGQQQKRIFDRFYQAVDDQEKTFPGFGMGLYISKEIIKRHKGNIWVVSEKGKGSTFYFTLPVKK
jgi:PAS domain S-box-containing protein